MYLQPFSPPCNRTPVPYFPILPPVARAKHAALGTPSMASKMLGLVPPQSQSSLQSCFPLPISITPRKTFPPLFIATNNAYFLKSRASYYTEGRAPAVKLAQQLGRDPQTINAVARISAHKDAPSKQQQLLSTRKYAPSCLATPRLMEVRQRQVVGSPVREDG